MKSTGGASGKEPTCKCRRRERLRFYPWVRKIPRRRAWQYSHLENPMDRGVWRATAHRVAESDTTERLTHREYSATAGIQGLELSY